MNTRITIACLKELWLPAQADGGSVSAFTDVVRRALFQRTDPASRKRRSVIEFLAQVSLFEDLDRRELDQLARIVHERDYCDGAWVCEQGLPGAALFVVRRGVVEVVRHGPRGEEVSLAVLEPPASFEESAALGAGMIRWFSVRARGPVSLLALGRSDLDALMLDFPALANKVLIRLAAVMATRLHVVVETQLLGEVRDGEGPR